MLDEILATTEPHPAYLHRHVLQLYVLRHRRAPETETERRRAVYEYLTRGRHEKKDKPPIHLNAALVAWLTETDDHVRAWGPLPRLAGLVHQFSGEVRKQYDLGTERDYKEYCCRIALSVQGMLEWPEEIVGPALRAVLWEPAPGIASRSKIRVTRAIQFVKRNAASVRHLDLSRIEDWSQMLLSVLSDLEQGKLPSYTLSEEQYAYLSEPVPLESSLRVTGLVHHLVVERGLARQRELSRPDVADTVGRQVPGLLARLRLPARVREGQTGALARVSAIAPATPKPIPMVTVVGPLSHGSGLGAAARACVEAFKAAQIPVEVLNLTASWGRNDEDEGSGLVRRVRGDVNVVHFNPDVIIENLARFGIGQFEGRYNIGYFVWETSQATLAHRLGVDLVDEVWVPTRYCQEIFERITDKPVVVVRTPVPKIDSVGWANRRVFDLPEKAFTFVFTFDGASRFTRKNPLGVVEAFQRAFPGDDGVVLVLKTQNTSRLHPVDERIYAEIRRRARADRRVVVIDESFSSNEVHGLIAVSDCYVALHRAEGFGYGMAEAMKLRVPVIATGYSGNADFTTEETSYPVRYRLEPVTRKDFVYEEDGQQWADPDVDHAAERMREVRRDPRRAAKVERAHENVSRLYDEAAVGRTYRQRIEAIRAHAGAGEKPGMEARA